MIKHAFKFLAVALLQTFALTASSNQTPTISPVLPPDGLPFKVSIDLLDLELPNGWHSGAVGLWKSKCLLIAGRTNGLHGFDNDPNVNNFPPRAQNKVIYVIDFKHGQVWQRSLEDSNSGLTQEQIDILSATSPQSYQREETLYIAGGYGVVTATGKMNTKPVLTALDIPKVIKWVVEAEEGDILSSHIRQTTHQLLQVTGGYMNQFDHHEPTLLIFGQNFVGYYRDGSNGYYTNQVRTFQIKDNGEKLSIEPTEEQPPRNTAYRRRDLNVVPVLLPGHHHYPAYIAFSGVFTEDDGIWTVPVIINPNGSSYMLNPDEPKTFKQAMNNYASPTAGLYSEKDEAMYVLIFGGITFGYFKDGEFKTDDEFPFTNEVTTIKMEKHHQFTQHIMECEYPVILSQFSNPGNRLLFGAGAAFIPGRHLSHYSNGVYKLDHLIHDTHVIGYIVGGIQSSLDNTNSPADSAASPYIFKVTLQPRYP